ncbi:hypothetical protein E2C01_019153 [Portunus trituberculatus]|uniref:Uncharacterized protein n=1 Tax=Portunus trituberculatus TaxID=210409 RepID=A0A5B7DXH8_PORTR|nr:hypothetical protein [Portunus trituberculatus]
MSHIAIGKYRLVGTLAEVNVNKQLPVKMSSSSDDTDGFSSYGVLEELTEKKMTVDTSLAK